MSWKRRQKVRLHMIDSGPSIEGFLIGRSAGHYRLLQADLIEAPDRSHEVGEIYVPCGRVSFYQVVA